MSKTYHNPEKLRITPAQIEALSFDELRELICICLEHLTREHVAMLAEARS